MRDTKNAIKISHKANRFLKILVSIANWIIGLLGIIWVAYWLPYAYIIGGHRSWKSHSIPIGTIGRIIYFNALMFLLVACITYVGIEYAGWKKIAYELYFDVWLVPYFLSQFMSWTIGDTIHLILDYNLRIRHIVEQRMNNGSNKRTDNRRRTG